MKKILLSLATVAAIITSITSTANAKEYTIKAVTDYKAKKQHFFSPDKVTIQPGDTVTFENAQDEPHNVMFDNVPKAVDEMIMSPMQEKKGDKFSYIFTVPGTYKFHCHPHESLGMEGTLIVGQASKPGETKSMDHGKLAENMEKGVESHHHDGTKATCHHDSKAATNSNPPQGTGQPQGTGKVVSVDVQKRTIKLTHDPIKALNWPKMTMTFTADSGVDLSGYKADDVVSFILKPQGKDDYTIVNLKKGK